MWPFSRVRKPSPPRLVDLENRLGELETAIEWLRKSVRDLNARVTTVQRKGAVSEAKEVTSEEDLTAPQITPKVFPRERSRRGF